MNTYCTPLFDGERRDRLIQQAAPLTLDDPDAQLGFTDRLAREQHGWTRDYSAAVVREYKRYFVLMALSTRPVTPSEAIDQVWHLHLVYTHSYHAWCDALVGRYMHHGPTKGGASEGTRFEGQYEYTLALYEAVFGETPPAHIWPDAKTRFSPSERSVWVKADELRARVYAPRLVMAATLVLGMLLGVILVKTPVHWPGAFETTYAQSSTQNDDAYEDSDDSSLIVLGLIAGVLGIIFLFALTNPKSRGKDGGSGCSGSWGGCGGGGGCSSGCGAGCGGCGG